MPKAQKGESMPANPAFVDDDIEVPEASADEYQQGDQFDKGSDDFAVDQTEVMPEGNYCCRFEKGVMNGQQGSGNWQFVFDFVVTEGEYRNKGLKAFATLEKEGQTKNMNWKLDEIMSALKAPYVEVNGRKQWKGSFSKMVGRAVIIEVKHYNERESVSKVSAPDQRAEEAARDFV